MSKALRLEKEQRERDELLDAAVFELNQKINLTIINIDDDKANALTDLLRVQFVNIIAELDALRASRDEAQIAFQSERIRQWLSSLNRSAFIPLAFRIKHLKKIESYLDLIAEDMGSLVMRAYKVGVLHIKEKASQSTALYQEMVHVTGVAIELAVRNMLRGFALHLSPSILDVRQTFDLARLGLVIARTLDQDKASEDILRLKHAMIQHELLRRMDMFSLTSQEQAIVNKRLHDFVQHANIEYLRAGEGPYCIDTGPYLVSRMDYPHLKPRRSGHLSDIILMNAFLIHAEQMFQQAVAGVEGMGGVTPIKLELAELHLEDDADSFSLCAKMLLKTFKSEERSSRQGLSESHLTVPVRLALTQTEGVYAVDSSILYDDWGVVNLSKYGVMLESNHAPFPVSALIEINLSSTPRYGLVRWYRATLQGDVRCGIEFIASEVVSAKIALLNFSSSDSLEKYWLALLEKVPSGWNVWLGGWQGKPVAMTVNIKREHKAHTVCRMTPTGDMGVNYAVFHITEVMSVEATQSMRSMSRMNSIRRIEGKH